MLWYQQNSFVYYCLFNLNFLCEYPSLKIIINYFLLFELIDWDTFITTLNFSFESLFHFLILGYCWIKLAHRIDSELFNQIYDCYFSIWLNSVYFINFRKFQPVFHLLYRLLHLAMCVYSHFHYYKIDCRCWCCYCILNNYHRI